MSRTWSGTDCGKTHYHTLVLDSEGETLLSRRVSNDEPELLKLIGDVLDLADGRQVTWPLAWRAAGLALGVLDGLLVGEDPDAARFGENVDLPVEQLPLSYVVVKAARPRPPRFPCSPPWTCSPVPFCRPWSH